MCRFQTAVGDDPKLTPGGLTLCVVETARKSRASGLPSLANGQIVSQAVLQSHRYSAAAAALNSGRSQLDDCPWASRTHGFSRPVVAMAKIVVAKNRMRFRMASS